MKNLIVATTLLIAANAWASPMPIWRPAIVDKAEADWTAKTAGRVLQFSDGGSGVLVAYTSSGSGLFLTAAHVIREALSTKEEIPSFSERGDIHKAASPILAGMTEIKTLLVYHPALSQQAPQTKVESDFSVGLVGSERSTSDFVNGRYRPTLSTLGTYNSNVYTDPGHHLSTAETAKPESAKWAIAIGYPAHQSSGLRQPFYSIGMILPDDFAARILSQNAQPFHAGAEFLISAEGEVGMSGGGVFDESGRLLGIIVRSLEIPGGGSYLRVVRADYALSKASERLKNMNALESLGILNECSTTKAPRALTCGALFH